MNTNFTKTEIIDMLYNLMNQRPGLDPHDYISNWADVHGRAAYRQDQRRTIEQLHDARTLIASVINSQITSAELASAFDCSFSGRLTLTPDGLHYCTGQYYPTEYRAAVCAVLASALWEYHRPDCMNDPKPGDSIRAKFRRMFGKSIQSRWFN